MKILSLGFFSFRTQTSLFKFLFKSMIHSKNINQVDSNSLQNFQFSLFNVCVITEKQKEPELCSIYK